MESRKVPVKLLAVGDKIRWIDGEFVEVLAMGGYNPYIHMRVDNASVVIHEDNMVEVAYEFLTYAPGTPITELTVIDRSIKVHFQCINHPDNQWMSKDPMISTWFPANLETTEHPFVCECKGEHWVLASEYKPQRQG